MNQENNGKSSAIRKMVYYLWGMPIVSPLIMWAMAEMNYRNMRSNPFREVGEIAIFAITLGLSLYCFHMLAKTVKCQNCENLYFNGSYKKALFPQKGCSCCGK